MPKCIERACPFPSILPADAELPYCRQHWAMANPAGRYDGINPFPTILAEHKFVEETLRSIEKSNKRNYCTRNNNEPASEHLMLQAYKENRRRNRETKKVQLAATIAPSKELRRLQYQSRIKALGGAIVDSYMRSGKEILYPTTNTIAMTVINDNPMSEPVPVQRTQHE